MKQLTKQKIKKLEKLNKQLVLLEKTIYKRSKEQNQIAANKLMRKEHNIRDYELQAEISYFSGKGKDHIATSTIDMLSEILCNRSRWGISEIEGYNITHHYQKDEELNLQKHCCLMTILYEFCKYNWENIFRIDAIYFNIKTIYKYKFLGTY